MERRKLERNSGSIGLNIPKKYAKIIGIKPGDYVNVTLTTDKKLIVEPADQNKGEATP